MQRHGGFALLTSLLVASLVFVLCLSLLAFAQSQNQYNVVNEYRDRAFYCASSGLETYKMQSELFAAGTDMKALLPTQPNSSFTQGFDVTMAADGTVTSVGTVTNLAGTKVLATCTLVAPQGNFTQVQDVDS
jgi:type II secretory pathway pseudopilin PulG